MGLGRFTAAVMWVINEVFVSSLSNSDESILLCEQDEKTGIFLLSEIEIAGNFGKWDRIIKHNENIFVRTLSKLKRLTIFFSLSPSEVLWHQYGSCSTGVGGKFIIIDK